MKKILIAVDNIRNSTEILSLFNKLTWSIEDIILLHVEQLEGNSLMIAMLGDAEMSTLKESLKGTEYKEALDNIAKKVLTYYKYILSKEGQRNIKTMIREGNPAEEIIKVSEEEGVDLIIVSCSGKTRLQRLLTGCTSREVENRAKMPVLITKGKGYGCGEHEYLWSERREVYVS